MLHLTNFVPFVKLYRAAVSPCPWNDGSRRPLRRLATVLESLGVCVHEYTKNTDVTETKMSFGRVNAAWKEDEKLRNM